jgi:group I intron endonuclease
VPRSDGVKRYGSIYILQNRVSGDMYIGQTRQALRKRISSHIGSSKKPRFPVHECIAKHGIELFEIYEIFVAFDEDSLNLYEKHFIDTLMPNLNVTKGGSGRSASVSDELKKIRSDQAKQRWANPVWREKTIQALRASNTTDEFREKIRNIKLRQVKKIYKPVVAKPKVNRSEVVAKTWLNEDVRNRRIESLKKTKNTDESKLSVSRKSKGRKMAFEAIQKCTKAKLRPVFCKELLTTFLSQKDAAAFLQVSKALVTKAVQNRSLIGGMYTLSRVQP